jgi:hypothetical protein
MAKRKIMAKELLARVESNVYKRRQHRERAALETKQARMQDQEGSKRHEASGQVARSFQFGEEAV